MEDRLDVEVIVSPNPAMETPHYQVQRINVSESESAPAQKESYKFADPPPEVHPDVTRGEQKSPEVPVLTQVMPDKPAPRRVAKPGKGLIARLFGNLFGVADTEKKQESAEEEPYRPRSPRGGRGRGRRPSGGVASERQQQQRRTRRNGSGDNNRRRQGREQRGGNRSSSARGWRGGRDDREKGSGEAEERKPATPSQAVAETRADYAAEERKPSNPAPAETP